MEGLVGWPIADAFTHKVVTRQPWIRRRSGKVRRLQTDIVTTEPRLIGICLPTLVNRTDLWLRVYSVKQFFWRCRIFVWHWEKQYTVANHVHTYVHCCKCSWCFLYIAGEVRLSTRLISAKILNRWTFFLGVEHTNYCFAVVFLVSSRCHHHHRMKRLWWLAVRKTVRTPNKVPKKFRKSFDSAWDGTPNQKLSDTTETIDVGGIWWWPK